MKKIKEWFSKMDTSKKLLLFVSIVWLCATLVNYYFGYTGVESQTVNSTYTLVNGAFMLEIGNYTVKSGFENVAKIKNSKSQELLDKMEELI